MIDREFEQQVREFSERQRRRESERRAVRLAGWLLLGATLAFSALMWWVVR